MRDSKFGNDVPLDKPLRIYIPIPTRSHLQIPAALREGPTMSKPY